MWCGPRYAARGRPGAASEWPGASVFRPCPHAFWFPSSCLAKAGAVVAGGRVLAWSCGRGCVGTEPLGTDLFGAEPLVAERCVAARAARDGGESAAVCVLTGADATVVGWPTTGFVCAAACTGALTAATTSPATSLSAGATPEDRAEVPPPGSKRSAREIDATASAAGKKALVTAACGFILGDAPKAATTGRSRHKR